MKIARTIFLCCGLVMLVIPMASGFGNGHDIVSSNDNDFSAVGIPDGYHLGNSLVTDHIDDLFSDHPGSNVDTNHGSIKFDKNVQKAYSKSQALNISSGSNWRLQLTRELDGDSCDNTGFAVSVVLSSDTSTVPNLPVSIADFNQATSLSNGVSFGVYPQKAYILCPGAPKQQSNVNINGDEVKFVFQSINGNITLSKIDDNQNPKQLIGVQIGVQIPRTIISVNLVIGGSTGDCKLKISDIDLYPINNAPQNTQSTSSTPKSTTNVASSTTTSIGPNMGLLTTSKTVSTASTSNVLFATTPKTSTAVTGSTTHISSGSSATTSKTSTVVTGPTTHISSGSSTITFKTSTAVTGSTPNIPSGSSATTFNSQTMQTKTNTDGTSVAGNLGSQTPALPTKTGSAASTKDSSGSKATSLATTADVGIDDHATSTTVTVSSSNRTSSKTASPTTSPKATTKQQAKTTATHAGTPDSSSSSPPVKAAYQYKVKTTMKVTKVMLGNSRRRRASSDCSCLSPDDWPTDMNTTSSPMYQSVAKIFSLQIAALYQKAGFAVTADDVNITAIAPIVGTIAVIYESIVKSGSAYTEDSLKKTVTNALHDMQAQGAFADAFGPEGVTSMDIQHVADGSGDGGAISAQTRNAIIGGVIGGAALIAIIVGIVLIVRHNKKQNMAKQKAKGQDFQ